MNNKYKVVGMVVASLDKEHMAKINADQEIVIYNIHTHRDFRFSDIGSAFNTAIAILELCVRATFIKTKIVLGPKKTAGDWSKYDVIVDTDEVKPHLEGHKIYKA